MAASPGGRAAAASRVRVSAKRAWRRRRGGDEYERVFEGFVRLSWSRTVSALSWAGGPVVMSVVLGPWGVKIEKVCLGFCQFPKYKIKKMSYRSFFAKYHPDFVWLVHDCHKLVSCSHCFVFCIYKTIKQSRF